MSTENKFEVMITEAGSIRAQPAIWYAGMVNRIFTVIKSKEWSSIYEVVKGRYKGKVIDPKDCTIVRHPLTPHL